MPENPPFPGNTCSACSASPVAVYYDYAGHKCLPCVVQDTSYGRCDATCIFCKASWILSGKMCLYGQKGFSCRCCTDEYKAAADKADDEPMSTSFDVDGIAGSILFKDTPKFTGSVAVEVVYYSNSRAFNVSVAGAYSLKKKIKVDVVDFTTEVCPVPSGLNDQDAFNISVAIMPRNANLAAPALKWFHEHIEMRDLSLVIDPDSTVDISTLVDTLVSSEALQCGALITHLVLFPRLHFARVVTDAKELIGPKVLAAAAFGGFDPSDLNAVASHIGIGAKSYNRRCRVHTYVCMGWEEAEVQGRWPAWEATLVAGPATNDSSFALVIDSGMFSDVTHDSAGAEEESNFNDLEEFNDLKEEYWQWADFEENDHKADDEAAATAAKKKASCTHYEIRASATGLLAMDIGGKSDSYFKRLQSVRGPFPKA